MRPTEQPKGRRAKPLEISTAQNKAAGELVDLVASKLGSGRAVHSETAIASTARLAGSLLFRSFNLDISPAKPGSVVLSHEANEAGPQLITIMSAMLQHFGVSLNQEKLGGEASKRGGPTELSVVESLALLQDDAMRISHDNGLGLKEAAQAAAMATAFVVKECAGTLGPEVSFNISAYSFIEGCKTVPPDIVASSTSPVQKRPWYRVW
ncbi:hypothetical protein AB4Z46_08005 [Variovorax sp. M-6]|uniref:hypothetical protein n=1 Tax=Variovorax sp. M-6 TaxID=3233041 RepID=UPI003F9AD66E